MMGKRLRARLTAIMPLLVTGWLAILNAGCESLPRSGAAPVPSATAVPASPQANLDQAATLQVDGRIDEARTLLARLLKREPSNVAALERLARISEQSGDARLERATLLRLMEVEWDSAATQARCGNRLLVLSASLARLESGVQTAAWSQSAASALASASTAVATQDAALRALRRAVELEVSNPRRTQDLIVALVGCERPDEAVAIATQALDRNLRDPGLAMVAARLFESRGELAQALRCYDLALQSAPRNRETKRLRAVCLYRLGDFSAAATDFEGALTGTAVQPRLAEFLMWSEACLAAGQIREASRVLDQIVADKSLQSPAAEDLRRRIAAQANGTDFK